MLSTEIAQDIYTNSLSLVNFINNYTAKENLPQDQINEVQIRVETLEKMVMDLSNIGTTFDLTPLRNAINTGKALTAAPPSPAPGLGGAQPSPALGFSDPGFAGLNKFVSIHRLRVIFKKMDLNSLPEALEGNGSIRRNI